MFSSWKIDRKCKRKKTEMKSRRNEKKNERNKEWSKIKINLKLINYFYLLF